MSQGAVLVIEDDEAIAALLADVLRAEGYRVTRMVGPGDALALLTAAGPDAFDVVLSQPFSRQRADPDAFLGQLRARTNAPIVICARLPAPVCADNWRRGSASFLAEPLDLADLMALVTSLAPTADEPVRA